MLKRTTSPLRSCRACCPEAATRKVQAPLAQAGPWPSSPQAQHPLSPTEHLCLKKKKGGGLRNPLLRGQIIEDLILVPILPLNSFIMSGTRKQGHLLSRGLFQPHHSVFKNVLQLEVSTPKYCCCFDCLACATLLLPRPPPSSTHCCEFQSWRESQPDSNGDGSPLFLSRAARRAGEASCFPCSGPADPQGPALEQQSAADLPSACQL